jgi:hypothetical protein
METLVQELHGQCLHGPNVGNLMLLGSKKEQGPKALLF